MMEILSTELHKIGSSVLSFAEKDVQLENPFLSNFYFQNMVSAITSLQSLRAILRLNGDGATGSVRFAVSG
jgi:hypothetical protein